MWNMLKLLDPKLWLLLLISLLLAFGSGFFLGVQWQQGREAKKEVAVVKQIVKDTDTAVKKDVAAETAAAPKKAETKATNKALQAEVIHATITETVYLKPECNITPDVMRNINSEITNTNAAIGGVN